MSSITETKLSITRNRWARYIAGGIKSANDSFVKVAANAEKLSKMKDNGVDNNETTVKGVDEEYYTGYEIYHDDESGADYIINDRGQRVDLDGEFNNNVETDLGSIGSWAKGVSSSEAYQKISGVLNSKAMKAGVKAAEIGCGLAEALVTIYTIASAYQSLQFLNLISGYLEAVDKVKAGDGSGSPIHNYNNNLTVKAETIDSNTNKGTGVSKTAMESQGMTSLFSGKSPNSSDASVQNINFESLMSQMSILTSGSEYTAKTFEACGYIKIATSTISLATTVISFIPIIGQGVKGAEVIVKALKRAAVSAVISTAIQIIIPIATRKIAELVIKNAATEWFGEDLGNALYSGASKYLGGNGTSGGQSPGSRQKVLAYLNEKETVIADEAEYQRSVRSPFDITSPYTFMGSLAYSVLPLISSTNIGSILKSTSALTSDSLIALTPAASAIGANEELPPEGTCPLLESSGAVGDAFCNPIVITDTSTIGYSPVAISEVVRGLGGESDTVAAAGIYSKISSSNFDGDGKIKDGSNLAKYITYCGQRVSSYGLRDASILQMSSAAETATTVMSFIPVVGDIAGIVDAGVSAANMKWTTGEQCVATFDPEDSEGWENEYKYYQRYAENERLLENMNPGYKSTVTAYVEKYYDNNPIDNSIEGTLARFSGLSKEEVADTLALINYLAHVADYHPEERYAFGEPTIKTEKRLLFDNENQVASESFILLNQISFADVRNRSFAV